MEFSRQEYWSGLPFPSLVDLPKPGIEPKSSTLQADSLPAELPGKPCSSAVGQINITCPLRQVQYLLLLLLPKIHNLNPIIREQQTNPSYNFLKSESCSVMSNSLRSHGLSVQFSCPVMSNSWQPQGPQHTRPPCPSPTPRVYPNSCPSSW